MPLRGIAGMPGLTSQLPCTLSLWPCPRGLWGSSWDLTRATVANLGLFQIRVSAFDVRFGRRQLFGACRWVGCCEALLRVVVV